MSRPVVLSNGRMHVGINDFGLVHDFYYPYVGLENHAGAPGFRHRVGVWIDGVLSWLDDGSWQLSFSYPHQALVGHITARSEALQIILEFEDAVDNELDVFMRNIHVVNLADSEREIRLFLHQAFAIGDSRSNTDTARYLPDSDALLHYRGRRIFVISGRHVDAPFDQYAVGLFGIESHDGTWRDAEDGELSGSAVEHGRVDSIMRFRLHIGAHSSERVYYWIAAGTSMRQALHAHKQILADGVDARQHSTAKWWHAWLAPVMKRADHVPEAYRDTFISSAMIIKAHLDERGAVIASTDSAMLNYGRDAYAYTWPRDGAYVLWPLIRLGYTDEAFKFFDFCRHAMHPAGYLAHKYRADGALGSSWHSYLHPSGIVSPPIQEDETAIVLFVFCQYYHNHSDEQLLRKYYESLVKPMADFLREYIDPQTNLPRPSYDLWEEHFMTTTYTVAVTYAALVAASELADIVGDQDSVVAWRATAEDMYEAAHILLYDEEKKHFIKGLDYQNETEYIRDLTFDMSSFFGAFMYGLYEPESREVTETFETVQRTFGHPDTIGVPRYENDSYRRLDGMGSNFWPITTMWIAQYDIERNHDAAARKILDWVVSKALATGVLAEQVRPDGIVTSISPLVWSQAEFMSTVLDLINEEADP